MVCMGTGPSLTQTDVDYCRDKAHVIAVNDAYKLAPWADVLYAADRNWWVWHKGAPEFSGRRYSIERQPNGYPVQFLKNTGQFGLERDPIGLRTGYNSGYQSINLAVHFGATKILLLGFDMQGRHYFGEHPNRRVPPFELCLNAFTTLIDPLREAGVSVLNCTPGSAITCFPRAVLRDVLQAEVAA